MGIMPIQYHIVGRQMKNADDYINSLLNKINDREKDYKLNNSVYIKRIISMMKDYDLSMKDAILWDMDGFMEAPGANDMDFLYELDFYFWSNGLKLEDTVLYHDVVTGKDTDYVLSTLKITDE